MADEDLTIDKLGFTQLMKLKENEVDKVRVCDGIMLDLLVFRPIERRANRFA